MKMYYTVYKTLNLINQKTYIGAHKTTNLNDDYLGSGKALKNAILKYGVENFKKEILHIFDNSKMMYAKEKELVSESFIIEKTNYNLKPGGCGGFEYINSMESANIGFVVVKDENGKTQRVPVSDERYLSGELQPINKGLVSAKNNNGEIVKVDKKVFESDSSLVGICKNTKISEEGRKNISNGHKGLVPVKDSQGNRFSVSVDDPRYLSGELIHNKTDIPRTVDVKNKISQTKTGIKQTIVTCPFCKKEGGVSNMKRHHFDNCKLR